MEFIKQLPKAELHLHIEGTLEPEMILKLADRNKKKINYSTVDELRAAYSFNNLQEFLDIYYAGASVLLTEEDFFDLTYAYIKKANNNNIKHVEIFFDPQTHTSRGVSFDAVISGIKSALKKGEKDFGISYKVIMCFLRHLSQKEAFVTLNQALPYKNIIDGVGLDSSENGNPPSKFKDVFEEARNTGFFAVAHAGEEGPAQYIHEAIDLLKVVRIDHGNNCINDAELMKFLSLKQIPLTVCPLSNLSLKVVDDLRNHPLRKLMKENLLVTINSDDPAYFGGYLNENYFQTAKALSLSNNELALLAKNSFKASFMDEKAQQFYISEIDKLID